MGSSETSCGSDLMKRGCLSKAARFESGTLGRAGRLSGEDDIECYKIR